MADPFNINPTMLAQMGMLGSGGFGGAIDPSMFMDPRQRMRLQAAQGMMQEGISTAPVHSPFGGLARLAGALLGRDMVGGFDSHPAQAQGASLSDQTIQAFFGNTPRGKRMWDYYRNADPVTQYTMKTKTIPDLMAQQGGPFDIGQAGAKVDPLHPEDTPQTSPLGPDKVTALLHNYNQAVLSGRYSAGDLQVLQSDLGKTLAEGGWQGAFNPKTGIADFMPPKGEAQPGYKGAVVGATSAAQLPAQQALQASDPKQYEPGKPVTTAANLGVGGPSGGVSGGAPATYAPPGAAAAPTGAASPTGAPPGPAATGAPPAAPPAPPTPALPSSPTAATAITPPPPPPPPAAAAAAPAPPPPPPPPVQAAPPPPPPPQAGPPGPPPYGVTPPAGPIPGAAPSPGGFGGRDNAGSIPQNRFLKAGPTPYGAPPMVGPPPAPPPPAPPAATAPGAPPLTQTPPPADKGPQVVPPPPPVQGPPEDLGRAGAPPDFLVNATAGGPGGGVPSPLPLKPGSEGPPIPPAALAGGGIAGGDLRMGGAAPTAPAAAGAQAGGAGAAGATTAAPPPPPKEPTAQAGPPGSVPFDPANPLAGAGADFKPDSPYQPGTIHTSAGPIVKPTTDAASTMKKDADVYKANTDLYNRDQTAFGQLAVVSHDLQQINHGGSAMFNSGPLAPLKTEVMNRLNGIADIIDPQKTEIPRIDEKILGDYDSFNKVSTQMALALGGSVGGGAQSTVQSAFHGVPNPSLTARGNEYVTELLRQTYKREEDLHLYQSAYATDPTNLSNTYTGSVEKFNKAHPPEAYTNRAYYNMIDKPWIDMLKGGPLNATEAKAFDDMWGPGMAKFAASQYALHIMPGDL